MLTTYSYTSMRQFGDSIKRLGMGAFGEASRVADRLNSNLVFVVKKVDIERHIEIAITHNSDESRETAKAKILREAELMMGLSHEHIVTVYCSFEESNFFHIVMEYCPYGSLKQVITERKRSRDGSKYFKEKDILVWLAQLSAALVYLHDRMILHRDIKPDNIFRMSDKSVKLGDFGVAKEFTTTLDNAATSIGTYPYMSPESFGETGYSFKHDTWALGVVAYEIASLELPFGMSKLNNQMGCIRAILSGELSSLPESGQFSRDLSDLILNRMLVRPVDERAAMAEVTEHRALKADVRRVYAKAEIKNQKAEKDWKSDVSERFQLLQKELAQQKTQVEGLLRDLQQKDEELASVKEMYEELKHCWVEKQVPSTVSSIASDNPFRVVELPKTDGVGFGFTINSQYSGKVLIRHVVSGSVADRHGLKVGDILISVDEINVENKTISDIAKLLTKAKNSVKVGLRSSIEVR